MYTDKKGKIYSDSRKNNTDFALLHIFNLLGGCNILTYFLFK